MHRSSPHAASNRNGAASPHNRGRTSPSPPFRPTKEAPYSSPTIVRKASRNNVCRRLLMFVWILSIGGMSLVWNNLNRGGRSLSSTITFPDAPGVDWNGTATGRDENRSWSGISNRTANSFEIKRNEPKSPNGRTIIDPYSLKTGIDFFLRDRRVSPSANGVLWDLLEHYPSSSSQQPQHLEREENRPFLYYQHDILSPEIVCGAGPGQGMEQDAGYKLLVEKLRIHRDTHTASEAPRERSKVLCLVYTYSPMRHLLRAQALMWGKHCDGFLAFSNETFPELGIYVLPVDRSEQPDYPSNHQESYDNMWQKSRAIWKHVHDKFLDEFDYFYLSGDDVYLVVDNLRAYLSELETQHPKLPRHFGSWLPAKSMVAGGPGYVLNREGLKTYVGAAETNNNNSTSGSAWSTCLTHIHRPYEDRFLSQCLSKELGISGNETDTRDLSTGEQRFHDTDPASLYLFRAARSLEDRKASYFSRMAKAWEGQPMPGTLSERVGPKHGLEAAAKHSISFHRIHTPIYMARIHSILHASSCPIDSPLGRGLRKHFVPHGWSLPPKPLLVSET